MRAFSCGEPFVDVPSDHHVPDDDDLDQMATDIAVANIDRRRIPVFSEAFLYPRIGKGDARFVLAVADEYTKLIEKLGPDKVNELLGRVVGQPEGGRWEPVTEPMKEAT